MIALARRAGWLVACALLVVFFQSFLRQPMALALTLFVGACAIASALRPFHALVGLAALGPLASVIYAQGRGEAGNAVFAEALVLAFLTGWTARRVFDGVPLRVPAAVRWSALLLALLAVASAIVHGWGVRAEAPFEPLRNLLDWYVLRDYPLRPPGSAPIGNAIVWLEGVLLVLAAADTCALAPERRTTVVRAMVVGAAVAGVFSVRRLFELADKADRPLTAFFDHLAHTRISVHYGDKNAAGSYFALALVLAAGWLRARPVFAVLTALPIGAALWLTGSRMAYAAAFLALTALVVIQMRRAASSVTPRRAAGILAILLAAAVALVVFYPQGRNFKASGALEVRLGLARAAVQMAADEPVFGVGFGRFYGLSGHYAGEVLTKFQFSSENAHNNFLQVLAETGVPGLVAFVVLLGAALRRCLADEQPRPTPVAALAAGTAAYVLTCLSGHPLITPDAAYPFWIALGLAASPMRAVPAAPAPWKAAAGIVAIAVIALTPLRARSAALAANLEPLSSGFSMWQKDGSGGRHRFMGGRAMFYAPSDARAMRLDFRSGTIFRRGIEVTVLVEGREVNRILVSADDQWRTLRLILRRPESGAAYTRIDLVAAEPGQPPFETAATADNGLVMVAQPVYER